MCPRATAEQGGAAMWTAKSAHSFAEEEYIDLDLSSCGGEYEFRVCRSRAAPCAEEMLCRLHKVRLPDAEATGGGGGRRSTATVAPLQQHSHDVRGAQQPARTTTRAAEGRRKKAVRARLQVFFRSLFARTSCSDHERCHGGSIGAPPYSDRKSGGAACPTTTTLTLRSSIELEKLMDEVEEEEEHAAASARRQRKSFSAVIGWRPLTTTTTAAAGRGRNSCGSAPAAALKRSSSCRSESEGLIQGAIAYCKRSQFARKSVGDAALCSSRDLARTPS